MARKYTKREVYDIERQCPPPTREGTTLSCPYKALALSCYKVSLQCVVDFHAMFDSMLI